MIRNHQNLSMDQRQTICLQDFGGTETTAYFKQHDNQNSHSTLNPSATQSTSHEVEHLHCFCANTSPVFQLTRLIGLNIISTTHTARRTSTSETGTNSSRHVSYCHSTSFFSFPSLCNIFFTISYIYLSIWIYLHLREHLGVFFDGVDYYTLAVDIISNFIQAATLLLHARFKGKVFIKALQEMQIAYSHLKQLNLNFVLSKSLKIISMCLVAFILTTTFIYGCLFLYLIFGMTIPYQSANDTKNDWFTVAFIMQKFGHFLMPLYSQSFVALFVICTEVIRQLYIQLARQLQLYLTNNDGTMRMEPNTMHSVPSMKQVQNSSTLSVDIETCRLLYERLFKTVDTLSNYFGGSLLAVCSIAVLSVTAAVYTIILNKADAGIVLGVANAPQKEILNFFFVVWGFHLFFSFFVLAGVLISGQRVTLGVCHSFMYIEIR